MFNAQAVKAELHVKECGEHKPWFYITTLRIQPLPVMELDDRDPKEPE